MPEHIITSYKFEDLVNALYMGGGYSFIESEEMRVGQVFNCGEFTLGSYVEYDTLIYNREGEQEYADWRDIIRHNRYPKFCTTAIIRDMVNKGYLPEGTIKIEIVG
jgi:hypothetical protein